MQKLVITTITGGLLAASSAVAGDFSQPIAPAKAPVADVGSLAAGYNSTHVFRGLNAGNDQVTAQVGYAVNALGQDIDFSALYGSSESTETGLGKDVLTLAAVTSRDFGFVTGHLGYQFREYFDAPNHQEVIFGISKDIFGVNTSITHYWAVDSSDNQGYTELGLSKGLNVFGHDLNLGATVGYLIEEGGFSHATIKLSYDIPVGRATLTPYVGYAFELDELEQYNGLPQTTGVSQENEFFAGAALRVNF